MNEGQCLKLKGRHLPEEEAALAKHEWRPENAKRKRGRCCTWWRETVERDTNLAGMDHDLVWINTIKDTILL